MPPAPRPAPPVRRALLLCLFASLGCQSVYYDAMERLGKHKRHILRDRVEAARGEQQEAEEQFQTAYERFVQLTGYPGGDLEEVYTRLAGELSKSEEKADAVRQRIDSIEDVAGDLFAEWEAELELIQNPRLRSDSAASLADTKQRYGQLIRAMQRAEQKMDPVLVAFRDQVLYLKHNLNARAIAAIESDVAEIEGDVAALIEEIRLSIRESESFLETLGDTA
ncbi:MAG: DUF2959 family protein [Myxococcota bacterium]